MWHKHFHSVDIPRPSVSDPADTRMGALIQPLPNSKIEPALLLAGYPDHEGIVLSRGRPGAAEAPLKIRQWFYKMTPAPRMSEPLPVLFEVGDLNINDLSLLERHEAVRYAVSEALHQGHRWLSFGGGHDYGYADGAGFVDWCRQHHHERPLVINFDAHLDVRPYTDLPSSGTPFRRLLELEPKLDFLEVGVGRHCASPAHAKWIEDRGGKILYLDDIFLSGESPAQSILRFLNPSMERRRRPAFLSIDIDVLSSQFSPGASQSWPLGLDTSTLFQVMEVLSARLDWKVAGIYEVSPPLDQADQTVKAAALLAHQLWRNSSVRPI